VRQIVATVRLKTRDLIGADLSVVEDQSQAPSVPCNDLGCDTVWLPGVSADGALCQLSLHFLERGHLVLDGLEIDGFVQVRVGDASETFPELTLRSEEQRVTLPEGHVLEPVVASQPLVLTTQRASTNPLRIRLAGQGPSAPWVELELVI